MAKIDIANLERDIKSLVAEIVECDLEDVTPNARFVEDLGMDSMQALEILAAVEKEYKIQLPEEYLGKISTLSELLKLTKGFLSKK